MCNHKKIAGSGGQGNFEAFNAFNRIFIEEAEANVIVMPMAKALVFIREPEDNISIFIPDTVYGLESTHPERSRVSGVETRIHADARI